MLRKLLLSFAFLTLPAMATDQVAFEIPQNEVENADRFFQQHLGRQRAPQNPVNISARPKFLDSNRPMLEVYWRSQDVRFINQVAHTNPQTLFVMNNLNKDIGARLGGMQGNGSFHVSKGTASIETRRFIYEEVARQAMFSAKHKNNLEILARLSGKPTEVEYCFQEYGNDRIGVSMTSERVRIHQAILWFANEAAKGVLGNKNLDQVIGEAVVEFNNLNFTRKKFTKEYVLRLLNYKGKNEGEEIDFAALVNKVVQEYDSPLKWENLDNGVEVNRPLVPLIYTDGQSVRSASKNGNVIQTPINPFIRWAFVSKRQGDGDCCIHAMGLTNYFYKTTDRNLPQLKEGVGVPVRMEGYGTLISSERPNIIERFNQNFPTRQFAIVSALKAITEENENMNKIPAIELFKYHFLNIKPEGSRPLGKEVISQIATLFRQAVTESTGQNIDKLVDEQSKYEDGLEKDPPQYEVNPRGGLPISMNISDGQTPCYLGFYNKPELTQQYIISQYIIANDYLNIDKNKHDKSIADLVAIENKVSYEAWRDSQLGTNERGYQLFKVGGDLSGEHVKKTYPKHSGIHFDAFVPVQSSSYKRIGSNKRLDQENYQDPANGSKYTVEVEKGPDLNYAIESRVHELLYNIGPERKDINDIFSSGSSPTKSEKKFDFDFPVDFGDFDFPYDPKDFGDFSSKEPKKERLEIKKNSSRKTRNSKEMPVKKSFNFNLNNFLNRKNLSTNSKGEEEKRKQLEEDQQKQLLEYQKKQQEKTKGNK